MKNVNIPSVSHVILQLKILIYNYNEHVLAVSQEEETELSSW